MNLLPRRVNKVNASVDGAGTQAKRARAVKREITSDQSAKRVASKAEKIYKARAPKRSGRLQRGIKVVGSGDTITISARAIDPKSKYDYVAVSRLGHRKRYIFPTHTSRRIESFGQTGHAYLKFRGWGPWSHGNRRGKQARARMWWLTGVRGFRPKADWVKVSFPAVKSVANAEMKATGNRITARWGKG